MTLSRVLVSLVLNEISVKSFFSFYRHGHLITPSIVLSIFEIASNAHHHYTIKNKTKKKKIHLFIEWKPSTSFHPSICSSAIFSIFIYVSPKNSDSLQLELMSFEEDERFSVVHFWSAWFQMTTLQMGENVCLSFEWRIHWNLYKIRKKHDSIHQKSKIRRNKMK